MFLEFKFSLLFLFYYRTSIIGDYSGGDINELCNEVVPLFSPKTTQALDAVAKQFSKGTFHQKYIHPGQRFP